MLPHCLIILAVAYLFGEREIFFAGIDENGYGPILGPLVVTMTTGTIRGDPLIEARLDRYIFPLRIEDSKRIFQRSKSSYSGGEITAHSLLRCVGVEARSLKELAERLTGEDWREIIGGSMSLMRFQKNIELPRWAKRIENGELCEFLKKVRVVLRSIKSKIIMPYKFNRKVERLQSKALYDLSLFMDLLKAQGEVEVALLGKVGGTRRYGPLFESLNIEVKETLEEKPVHSAYLIELDGKELEVHFLKDGDTIYFPIAFSSIVGKYVRELFMQSLNESLGFDEEIPYASGYRHDEKTYRVIDRLLEILPESEVQENFIRQR